MPNITLKRRIETEFFGEDADPRWQKVKIGDADAFRLDFLII